jgi:lipopolysaccharide transport system permease protein
LLKPLVAMLVFTVIFGRIAHMPANGIPYPLLVLTGMIPWQFFAAVINESSISLSNNPNLVTKVWLPRILMPITPLLLNTVDAIINGILLVIVLLWYHIPASPHLLLAPFMGVPVVFLSVGLGLCVCTWMVKYKDIKNIIPIALQFGLLCSPVAFTLQVAPPEWASWLWLNPLSVPIEWFRWSLIPGQVAPSLFHSLIGILESVAILLMGYRYFRRNEGRLADVI